MLSLRNLCRAVIAGIIGLSLVSCSAKQSQSPSTVMPATSSVQITLEKKRIPDTCDVFAHLIFTVPANMPASSLKKSIEQYAMSNGADFVLIGMTRESNDAPQSVLFQTYGPQTPYSFKQRWLGWKFGFSDWNRGGTLVDYGYDRLEGSEAAFDVPVEGQAVLLSCLPKS